MNYWEKILDSFSFKSKGGAPNFNNPNDRLLLRMELLKRGWNKNAVNELLYRLTEQQVQKVPVTGKNAKTERNVQRYYFYDKADNVIRARTDQYNQSKAGGNLPYATQDQVDDKTIGKEDDSEDRDDKKTDKEVNKNKVQGDPTEGDNQVKNEMLEHGYDGIEKALGKKPAPGGSGSAFNEIVSGQGVEILEEEDLSEEELAERLFDQFGDSTLGGEQKETVGIPVPQRFKDNINAAKKKEKDYIEKKLGPKPSKAKEPKKLKAWEKKRKELLKKDPTAISNSKELKKAQQDKATYTKCVISARSAKQKSDRSKRRTKTLQEQGLLGQKTNTHTFYGAEESLAGQVELIEETQKRGGKVLLPNGQEVSPQDAIDFINAGGGGDNPSDTATFVTDENGNILIQFHSDKTTTGDIQDNSTLAKEAQNYYDNIDKTNLSDDEKRRARKIIDVFIWSTNDIESKYNSQTSLIAGAIKEIPDEDENFGLSEQVRLIDEGAGKGGLMDTAKKNMDEALGLGKDGKSGKLRDKFLSHLPEGADPENLTTEQKYQMIRDYVESGGGVKKVPKKTISTVNKNPEKAQELGVRKNDKGEWEWIDTDANRDMTNNDTKVVAKVGQALEKVAKDKGIDKPKGINAKEVLSQNRENVVRAQRDRVDALNETQVTLPDGSKIGLGTLMEKEEVERGFHFGLMEDVDYDDSNENKKERMKGIMNSAFDVNMGGVVVTGETMKKCLGLTSDNPSGEFTKKFKLVEKEELTKDGDIVTGKVVYQYVLVEGEKEPRKIGFKTYRSKSGATGKTSTTLSYDTELQDCFKRESAK